MRYADLGKAVSALGRAIEGTNWNMVLVVTSPTGRTYRIVNLGSVLSIDAIKGLVSIVRIVPHADLPLPPVTDPTVLERYA